MSAGACGGGPAGARWPCGRGRSSGRAGPGEARGGGPLDWPIHGWLPVTSALERVITAADTASQEAGPPYRTGRAAEGRCDVVARPAALKRRTVFRPPIGR
jgi:hypothetical protein